jgi:hypothetical protein
MRLNLLRGLRSKKGDLCPDEFVEAFKAEPWGERLPFRHPVRMATIAKRRKAFSQFDIKYGDNSARCIFGCNSRQTAGNKPLPTGLQL